MKPKPKSRFNKLSKFKKGDLVFFDPRCSDETIDWGIIVTGPHPRNHGPDLYSVFYPSENAVLTTLSDCLFLLSHDHKARLCS